MTGDRPEGDTSPGDEFLNDDEFVLDLGDGEFDFSATSAFAGTIDAASATPPEQEEILAEDEDDRVPVDDAVDVTSGFEPTGSEGDRQAPGVEAGAGAGFDPWAAIESPAASDAVAGSADGFEELDALAAKAVVPDAAVPPVFDGQGFEGDDAAADSAFGDERAEERVDPIEAELGMVAPGAMEPAAFDADADAETDAFDAAASFDDASAPFELVEPAEQQEPEEQNADTASADFDFGLRPIGLPEDGDQEAEGTAATGDEDAGPALEDSPETLAFGSASMDSGVDVDTDAFDAAESTVGGLDGFDDASTPFELVEPGERDEPGEQDLDSASTDFNFGLRPIGLPEDGIGPQGLDLEFAAQGSDAPDDADLDRSAFGAEGSGGPASPASLAEGAFDLEPESGLDGIAPTLGGFDVDGPDTDDVGDALSAFGDPVPGSEGGDAWAESSVAPADSDTSGTDVVPDAFGADSTPAEELFGDAADVEPSTGGTMDFGAPIEPEGFDDALLDDELLDMGDDAPFDLVEAGDEPAQTEDEFRASDDVLFSDDRADIAPTSAFGADLGPTFGDHDDFDMPDLDFVEPAQSSADSEAKDPFSMNDGDEEADAFELDLSDDEFGEDAFFGAEESDDWREKPETASEPAAFGEPTEFSEAAAFEPEAFGQGAEAAPTMDFETEGTAAFAADLGLSSEEPVSGPMDGWGESTASGEDPLGLNEPQELDAVATGAGDWGPEAEAPWSPDAPTDAPALAEVDDDWAAATDPEADVDPIYGDEEAQGVDDAGELGSVIDHDFQAGPNAGYVNPATEAAHEEAYATAEAAPQVSGMAVAMRPRRSAWRWVATAAALLPIAIGGVVVFAKPDLVMKFIDKHRGQPQPILVDRIALARPQVVVPAIELPRVALAQPARIEPADGGGQAQTPAGVDETPTGVKDPVAATGAGGGEPATGGTADPSKVPESGDPATGQVTDPGSRGEVAVGPGRVPDPKDGGAEPNTAGPDGEIPDPTNQPAPFVVEVPTARTGMPSDVVVQTAPVRDGSEAGTDGVDGSGRSIKTEYLPAGDVLIARDPGIEVEMELPSIVDGLRLGVLAFVQLENGEFFTGRVSRLRSESVSIEQDSGVLTVPFSDVRTVSPLASADLSQFKATQQGFIRLQNNARLFGAMLRNPDESVTLQGEFGTITVPEWQIFRVGENSSRGAAIVRDEDGEAWLRERARQRLEAGRPGAHAVPR